MFLRIVVGVTLGILLGFWLFNQPEHDAPEPTTIRFEQE